VTPASTPKRWRREEEVLAHDLTLSAAPLIAAYIRLSRTAASVEAFATLQRRIAGSAIEMRESDRQDKRELKRLKAERSVHNQRTRCPSPEMNQMVADVDLRLRANRRRFLALRQVQDGIFWRLLQFDRQLISTYGLGQQVGYPSETFEVEYAAAEEEWGEGRLAVFCDLSSCIRTGDLLVFDPGDRSITVVEIGTTRSPRKTRQRQRVQARIAFLNEGRSTKLTDAPVVAVGKRPPLQTHLADLARLLTRAETEFAAGERIADHLYLEVVDARARGRDQLTEGELDEIAARIERSRSAAWPNEVNYEFDSSERLRRDHTTSTTTTAPFSIFPLDDETCAALCLGHVSYRTVLSPRVVRERLERRGWTVQWPSDERGMWIDVLARRDADIVTKVSSNISAAEQLAGELVTLEAFEQMIAAQVTHARALPPDRLRVPWAWSAEEEVWLRRERGSDERPTVNARPTADGA